MLLPLEAPAAKPHSSLCLSGSLFSVSTTKLSHLYPYPSSLSAQIKGEAVEWGNTNRRMLMKKDHLGLSLSLSPSDAACRFQLDLRPPTTSPLGSDHLAISGRGTDTVQRSMRTGHIDVNRAPMDEWEAENDAGGSSPNSTVSSASAVGRRGGGVNGVFLTTVEAIETEHESSRGVSDEEDGEGVRKKLRLSKDQSAILEESFKDHNTLNPKQKMALAKQLNLRPRQVEVWFQNRRARTKLKQTEVDCEFLKRCCDNLTEENRRLHKEVQELRALKLSPQVYMHMTPPTTLTICPACERVSPPPPPPASTAGTSAAENRLFLPTLCSATGARPPWPSIPLRPSFLDTPPQRH